MLGNTCGESSQQGHHVGYGGVKVGSREIIGWTEEGRWWNPVIATGEGEEHHA